MGFISLALCLASAVLVKARLPPRTGKQFFAFDLFMKPGYTTFWSVIVSSVINMCLFDDSVGMFFVVWGLFFLIFFLPSYGALHGFDANMTFYSVSVLNAASLVSSLIGSSYVSERFVI
jgi:hypothetical protein